MLELTSIDKEYPTRAEPLVVLSGVSMRVESGESVAIMGPSGSGKSTLLNIIGTLDKPTRGTMTIDGRSPLDLPDRELAKFRNKNVGFVFQEHHLLPQLSAIENVLLPTLATAQSTDPSARAEALLAQVGLANRAHHVPAELSGGERQRVAIARALIHEPGLLLADEPTGNLDQTSAEVVADLLFELHKKNGSILIVATHSPVLAAQCSRTLEISGGTLAQLSRPPAAP